MAAKGGTAMSLARFTAATVAAALALSGCTKDQFEPTPPNHPPVVDGGPDRHVVVGQAVILQATASDPDGDAVQVAWFLTPPYDSRARLAITIGPETGFVPDVPGTYFAAVAAYDGNLESDPALVMITVGDDALPTTVVAYAGPDQVAPLGGPVQLDGTGSADPDGYPLDFAWEWVSRPDGSAAALDDATRAKPSFMPDREGAYVLQVTVTALAGGTESDEVKIVVVNAPPTAAPGGDRDVSVGDAVALDAGAVDPDGEVISYAWTLASKPAGSAASLAGADTATPELVPDVAGWYVIALVVSDAGGTAPTVTFTVKAYPPLARLTHRVIDAEYAAGVDRIVMVDSDPNALYVYDPAAGTEEQILLSLAPAAVSVSPDGQFAVVSHDAYITYVDLVAAEVVRVIPVSARLGEIALAGNGYAYASASDPYSSDSLRIVNVVTGAVTTSSYYYYGYGGEMRLHPNGAWIYKADGSSSLRKLDISGGTTVAQRSGPYQSAYSVCGDVWPSEDGSRLFTGCGNVFRATAAAETDMTYGGKLEAMSGVVAVADSAEAAEVLAVASVPSWNGTGAADTLVHRFEATYLTETGTVPLSPFVTPAGSFRGHGRWVFFSADGTRHYAIVQADASSALLEDFAVMTF
jgi:chitinase